MLVFEILNESDAKHIAAIQTTEMNERILRVIRETNPSRYVIIGSMGDNDNADCFVNELKAPDDSHVIATRQRRRIPLADGVVIFTDVTTTNGAKFYQSFSIDGKPSIVQPVLWLNRSQCNISGNSYLRSSESTHYNKVVPDSALAMLPSSHFLSTVVDKITNKNHIIPCPIFTGSQQWNPCPREIP